MALYKSLTVNETTNVLIWKIEESLNELHEGITLSKNSEIRLLSMKSEIHQKGFLSIRHLLAIVNLSDSDLVYDEFGKPHLKDGRFISITHSFQFTGIIISSDCKVGIDIEKQREKILRIAHKFTPLQEYRTIANTDALIRKLTIVWGAKESLYKVYGKKQLLFLRDIFIADFRLTDGKTTGDIRFDGEEETYCINYIEFEDFTCVFAY